MTFRSLLAAIAVLAASLAHADDLWNQIAGLPKGFPNFPDQEFDDGVLDSFTTFMANDVEVGPTGWIIDSVTVEVGASQPTSFANLATARLNIFANPIGNATPAATDNPFNGTVVPVTITPVSGLSGFFYVTASGLNLSLGHGEYWIDLTPIGGITAIGESLEAYSPNNSAHAATGTAVINPGGGYAFKTGTQWDTLQNENGNNSPQYGAIDIQGSAAPEPATIGLLGLGGVALLRRRRK